MKIKESKTKEFEEMVETNSHDDYSKGTVDFAIRWAEEMETLLEKEEQNGVHKTPMKIGDVAKYAEKLADTDGITGFMYGCAMAILSKYWEYGEDLRIWHNSKFGATGEKANNNGGVINPPIWIAG